MTSLNFAQSPIPNPDQAELLEESISLFDLIWSRRLSSNDRASMLIDMHSITWQKFLQERLPLLMTKQQKQNLADMMERDTQFTELYAQMVNDVPNITQLWLEYADTYKRDWVKKFWSLQRKNLEEQELVNNPSQHEKIEKQLVIAKKAEKLADAENWSELLNLLKTESSN